MITRRHFIAGLGAAALAVGGNALLIEPRRVVITRHQINSDTTVATDPAIRVVQITDLHLQRVNEHAHRIAAAVNELSADLVVFTGDMIDKRDRVEELKAFLALLDERPLKYATLGNWEHWARVDLDKLTAAYAGFGCRLLINETAVLKHSGREALITGLDDWTAGEPDLAAALQNVAPLPNHIALAHSPVYRDVLSDARSIRQNPSPGFDASSYTVSCVLSGHTHGGQVAFFGWAPIRPAGSGHYVAGWYREVSPALYVSRGLGTSVAPVRFGAPPEIACFEWRLSAV